MFEENYVFLADAVIVQAAQNCRQAKALQMRTILKDFFLSEWFCALTDMDGKKLYNRLERERRTKRRRKL